VFCSFLVVHFRVEIFLQYCTVPIKILVPASELGPVSETQLYRNLSILTQKMDSKLSEI
jgi:hypothetical protein